MFSNGLIEHIEDCAGPVVVAHTKARHIARMTIDERMHDELPADEV